MTSPLSSRKTDAPARRSELIRTLAVVFLPLVVYAVVYFLDGSSFRPSGDGFYSWIFARSLSFDFDVEFTNDYALCGDPFRVGVDRGQGHPDNPFYAGPAFFGPVR
jgi:hypothetical protein